MHHTDPMNSNDRLALQPRQSCVLLVEDDATVAMIVEEILLDMGLQSMVVSTLDDALTDAELADFDAAIIDMHLRGEQADQLVEALLRDNVPFMILSGGDIADFRAAHPGIAILGKPFDKIELEHQVRALLAL